MKKYPIGFNTGMNNETENDVSMEVYERSTEPKKSIVQVYFPHRGMGWAYYNDSFDLKVGDYVYVEGRLEGYRGQVTEVNYSFKIKLSDYKKLAVSPHFLSWIMSFGKKAKIISPGYVVEEMYQLAREITEIYEG